MGCSSSGPLGGPLQPLSHIPDPAQPVTFFAAMPRTFAGREPGLMPGSGRYSVLKGDHELALPWLFVRVKASGDDRRWGPRQAPSMTLHNFVRKAEPLGKCVLNNPVLSDFERHEIERPFSASMVTVGYDEHDDLIGTMSDRDDKEKRSVQRRLRFAITTAAGAEWRLYYKVMGVHTEWRDRDSVSIETGVTHRAAHIEVVQRGTAGATSSANPLTESKQSESRFDNDTSFPLKIATPRLLSCKAFDALIEAEGVAVRTKPGYDPSAALLAALMAFTFPGMPCMARQLKEAGADLDNSLTGPARTDKVYVR